MSKAKTTLIGIAAVGLVTYLSWQQHIQRLLKRENQELRDRFRTLEEAMERTQDELRTRGSTTGRLRSQSMEIAVLRAKVPPLRTVPVVDSIQQEEVPPATQNKQEPAPVAEADVSAFLQRPPSEQGRLLGTLRREMMPGGIKSRGEAAQNVEAAPDKLLAAMVREKLEDLESNPTAFAEFQSSFIKDAIGLDDEKKVSQLREIIQTTYEQAVANGLDASARPQEGVESWALRRDALDRPATRQVEELLTPEERARFGRAFLGVMGIDLGLQDGARHRFVTPEGGVVFPSEQLQVGRPQPP